MVTAMAGKKTFDPLAGEANNYTSEKKAFDKQQAKKKETQKKQAQKKLRVKTERAENNDASKAAWGKHIKAKNLLIKIQTQKN